MVPITFSGDLEISVPCMVMENATEDLVIGAPFLQEQGAVVDLQHRTIHFGTNERVTLYTAVGSERPKRKLPMDNIAHGFSQEYLPRFRKIVDDFQEIFHEIGPHTTTSSVRHKIRLQDETPFRLPPRRYRADIKQEILRQTQQMLADGIIEPSESPYCSMVHLEKKENKTRYCVDYQQLNQVTIPEAAPLPAIADSLQDLGTAKIFTTMDLRKGYWQIPMDPESKKYTAFATPDGNVHQFCVMPFGLRNAPATFQRFMSTVLAGLTNQFVLVFLDDIIIYSNSPEEHLIHLRRVLERLSQHGLKCALDKCRFGQTELEYLGHVVSATGNQPQMKHLQQIEALPRPTTLKRLREFLGLCGWVRPYVPNYATIAAPLTDLLGKKKFVWTAEAEEAFGHLKAAIASPLKLSRPDPTRPYVLQTDASQEGTGAVLYQLREDKSKDIVGIHSARFRDPERRYHCNEQECLAIVLGVKHFWAYLEEKPFILRTDSQALVWMNKAKDTRNRVARWAMLLQELAFEVEHCSGKENQLPDFLSRNPSDEVVAIDPLRVGALTAQPDSLRELVVTRQGSTETIQNDIQRWNTLATMIGPFSKDDHRFVTNHLVREATLYWQTKDGHLSLVVPKNCQQDAIRYHHDHRLAGHPGAEETIRSLRRGYYWPTMLMDTRNYVRRCLTCAKSKRRPPQKPEPLRARQSKAAFEDIAMDLMGPYIPTPQDYRYLLVITDLFTRWVEAFPLKVATTEKIAEIAEREVFQRFGYPRTVITDNGPQFKGDQWDAACARWGASPRRTPLYHPRANPTERRNQEIKKGMRVRLDSEHPHLWINHVPDIVFALRRRENAATKQTPSQLLLGYNIPRPGDRTVDSTEIPQPLPERRAKAQAAQEGYQRRYQPTRAWPPRKFAIGENVLVQAAPFPGDRGQFAPKWTGPYPVIRRTGAHTYEVDVAGRVRNYHLERLQKLRRPVVATTQTQTQPSTSQTNQIRLPDAHLNVVSSEGGHLLQYDNKFAVIVGATGREKI